MIFVPATKCGGSTSPRARSAGRFVMRAAQYCAGICSRPYNGPRIPERMTSIHAKLREAGLFIKAREILGDQAIVRAQRVAALPFRRNLAVLGRIYWTDKTYVHGYTHFYQQHLQDFRRRPIRLLEIGIGGDSPTWGGASLRMW